MTETLARVSARRPWLVVGLWLIVIFTAVVLVAMFLAFEGEAEITRTTESKQAERILDEGFPQEAATGEAITEVVVVRAEAGDVHRKGTRPSSSWRWAGTERTTSTASSMWSSASTTNPVIGRPSPVSSRGTAMRTRRRWR